MSAESRRAVVLILLTAVAIALPAAAWWASGRAEASARAARWEAEARAAAEGEARALATQVSGALARIAELETRRPWRHYRNAAALREPPWTPDALVLAHFEILPKGSVRVTELGDEADAELAPPPLLCAIRDDLSARVPELWRAVRPECADPAASAPAGDDARVICVGALTWTTVTLGGVPSPVALRHVEMPEGALTQGLVVDPGALRGLGGWGRASLHAGAARGAQAVPVHLVGAEWHVAVDEAPLAAAAAQAESDLRGAFAQAFALGLAAAVLAGLAAVALAWQALLLARRRAELTAIAAHELRTPLAGIRLHAGMLAKGLGDPSRVAAQAEAVSHEAARLGRVVHNLLDGAAAESDPRPSPGRHLGDALRAAVAAVAPALQAGGASIRVDVAPDLPAVAFDEEATARILHDLLDNAEKYARGGADREILVQARATPDRRRVEIVVDDAGPGFTEAEARRAFRPFTRLPRREAPSGLGLGLALARRRAREMRGDLACGRSSRGGARMVLSLPVE